MHYNLDDFTYILRSDGFRSKRYRHWCSLCNKDRGYAYKNKIMKEPLCHGCKMASDVTKSKISKTSVGRRHTSASKNKISASLFRTYGTDPIRSKIKRNMRSRLGKALKGNFKSGSAIRDLGCSISFFKAYIEKLWKDGMNWENYGKEWELDHIKPLCLFDLSDRIELIEASNYKNIQPLWKKDNLQKRHFDGTFKDKQRTYT